MALYSGSSMPSLPPPHSQPPGSFETVLAGLPHDKDHFHTIPDCINHAASSTMLRR